MNHRSNVELITALAVPVLLVVVVAYCALTGRFHDGDRAMEAVCHYKPASGYGDCTLTNTTAVVGQACTGFVANTVVDTAPWDYGSLRPSRPGDREGRWS